MHETWYLKVLTSYNYQQIEIYFSILLFRCCVFGISRGNNGDKSEAELEMLRYRWWPFCVNGSQSLCLYFCGCIVCWNARQRRRGAPGGGEPRGWWSHFHCVSVLLLSSFTRQPSFLFLPHLSTLIVPLFNVTHNSLCDDKLVCKKLDGSKKYDSLKYKHF